MSFIAQYRSRCAAGCGDPIRPGDSAEYVADELMHEECADGGLSDRALERQLARERVCASCGLTHAGLC